MVKILFISFVQPFPADDGKKAVLRGLLRHFLAHPDTYVEYVVLGGASPAPPPQPRITFYPLGHTMREARLLLVLIRSLLGRRKPLQQALLYDESLRRALVRRMTASKPDIVIYDTLRVSQFIDSPRSVLPEARHVLYLDDLFSVRYEAMLRAMDDYPGARIEPLGNFAHHLPQVCRSVVNTRRVCRYLLRREMLLVREAERAETARFDVSLLVNPNEVGILRQSCARESVAMLPIALPLREERPPARSYEGWPEFVFIGALNVAHNQCSLEYFLTHVFADCLRIMPGIKLRVIGHSPSERLRKLFAQYASSIEWIAWIAELGEIFARSSAMLVPLLFGSGVKVKTLESLYRGLPVISTRFGAEGIVSNPTQASGIVMENDLRRFPEHMRSLLDRQSNERLSREAREYYAANYDEGAVARDYKTLFGL